MENKKILITGAGGFIGHHLAKYLKQRGYWVRGVDIKHPEFEPTVADDFKILDLRDLAACMQACVGMEEVYQLAADMGGIGYITAYHAVVFRNNALINLHMLEAARMNKVKKYLFTSSACIYPQHLQNKADVKPLREEDAYPADAEGGYGWEKLFAELACQYYLEDYGMKTYSIRFHNIFGPLGTYEGGREKSPAAICRKVALAKQEDEIEIWGDGCFPSGELIISNPELKRIEDFKINDLVLGINGFQKVTNTFSRNYDGTLFIIKPEGMMPFKVTAEHPILIFRLETFCKACSPHRCKPNCRNCYHSRCRHEIKFWKGWIKASEILSDRDYLCVSKLKREDLVRIDLRPYTLKGHGDGRLQEQPSIPII